MAIFTNQATLTYNGNIINSNITTGELIEVLSATKTAVIETYTQGQEVTYVINIVNSGTTAYTGLSITDDLGAYAFGVDVLVPLTYVNGSVRYYINGVLQPAPVVDPGPPLKINGVTVPAGGVATIIYVVTANQFASPEIEGNVVNNATISGAGITEITVSETINAETGARLTITKSISPTSVAENGRLTYTFTIQNIGNTPVQVADAVEVTDTFNPILSDLVVTYNGASWNTPANYSYNPVTGVFTTVAGQITVPAATYTQDATTGIWIVEPGVSVLTVTGTV
ncbi:MAG: hypothetical protein UF228_07455 [Lachnospiraceae bacterium]|nr:hypothetical protein [Lachnospiraceae bacterium]